MPESDLIAVVLVPTFAVFFALARQDRIQLQSKIPDLKSEQVYDQIAWASDYAAISIVAAVGEVYSLVLLGYSVYTATSPTVNLLIPPFVLLAFAAMALAFNEIHTTATLRSVKRSMDRLLKPGIQKKLGPPRY